MLSKRAVGILLCCALMALAGCTGGGGGGAAGGGYTISGAVSGLTGAGLILQNNAADDLPIAADGGFTFAATVADNTAFSVTVKTQPAGQSCTVNNGTGTVSGANIGDVAVTCSTDTTAPTIVSTTPSNSATNVALNTTVSAVFSEAVAGVDGTTFTLKDGAGNAVSGSVSYAGVTAVFTPSANLAGGATYAASIAMTVKDLSGNALAANHTWAFTTGTTTDTTPPTVDSTSPADNATGVSLGTAITATFSEAMDCSTVSAATVTIHYSGSNGVSGSISCGGAGVSFTPASQLTASTVYTARVTTGVKDSAGNALAAAHSWSFTTVASAPSAPPAPAVTLTPQAVKNFHFTWTDVSGETEYRLLEDADGSANFVQVATISAGSASYDRAAFLPGLVNANYILQACNSAGCTDSPTVSVTTSLAEATGYVKASNPEGIDQFGQVVAISSDGGTLVVGAPYEDSNSTGINGAEADNTAASSGAVYVFTRSAGVWTQQAYIKASNAEAGDSFGIAVAVSSDGNTVAVGATGEDSSATGVGGSESDNTAPASGAVYVFTRSAGVWTQQAYVKASNTAGSDMFGVAIALSSDGNTLAVGAPYEDSSATGIGGDQASNAASSSGAVYVFTRSAGTWAQQAYVKASTTAATDLFGVAVALSGDSNTLAVGAPGEDSSATGIGGDQADNTASSSGAVYVFTRSAAVWTQQAYVKASNTEANDYFGAALSLSVDGNTLAAGAYFEDSSAAGIGGAQADNGATDSGAVYVFARSGSTWSQQAYVKASNTGANDNFGASLSLSSDGAVLAVGAINEAGNATGLNGNGSNNSAVDSGAAYTYVRTGTVWASQSYVKAPNTGASDTFGYSVALSGDGGTLAVGAIGEASSATGIGGSQTNNSAGYSGAVYLY